MKIVTIPDKVLFGKAKLVTAFGPKLKKTVDEMKKTLEACKDPIGVGLAAPQVGLPQRMFIMKPTPRGGIQTFINPLIIQIDDTLKHNKKKSEKDESLEGCLSIPRIWGSVQRAPKLTLQWMDVEGITHTKEFSGFEGVIIQHEVDHLEGILFTHRSAEQQGVLYEEKEGKFYEVHL